MDFSPRGVVAYAKSPEGIKLYRYTMTSLIATVVSQVTLFGVLALHLLPAQGANVVAVAVGTVPSYELNRKWAWGKTGKGHLWKEIVPFWVLSFVGLVFSTLAVVIAVRYVGKNPETLGGKLAINGASLGSYAFLWVGKFIFYNKVLFAHRPEPLDPALDGRSRLPT